LKVLLQLLKKMYLLKKLMLLKQLWKQLVQKLNLNNSLCFKKDARKGVFFC